MLSHHPEHSASILLFANDFPAFVDEYDLDLPRSTRSSPLTEAERATIESFLSHGEIRRLAQDLGCSVPSAHARVTKFALERTASK